jgi:hypothetical protein
VKNKEEKEMYQNIMMKDEATMSHKDSQKGSHTHFTKEIVEGQLQKLVVTVNKEELAHGNKQKKEEEEHSYAMLSKWNEETELLDKMQRRTDSGREERTTRREKTCSQLPSKGRMLIASKEDEVNFNF